MKPARFVVLASLALGVCISDAQAQEIGFRGFADVGGTRFTAGQSFDAVLGTHTGVVFGGGVEVIVARDFFINVHASRFQKDGTRVFVLNEEVFDLGIPTTVRVTPVQITGGYRFKVGRRQIVPYVGGGVGWYRYSETSDFATGDEDVSETFTGYHLLGGAEVRVSRLFGVSGEVEWSGVPDALGQNPNSASAAFDETNLGGITFRVKFVVGK
jgi:opacity protein-like surface antigen